MNIVLKIKDTEGPKGQEYAIFTDHIVYLSTGLDPDKSTPFTFIHFDNKPALKIFKDLNQVIKEIASATSIDQVVKKTGDNQEGIFSAEELNTIANAKHPTKSNPHGLTGEEKLKVEVVMGMLKRQAEEGYYSVNLINLSKSAVDFLVLRGFQVARKPAAPHVIAGAPSEVEFEVSFRDI